MRFRFIRVLTLVMLLAAAFAGVAKALDFDDEDPHPPHPEIGLVYHYEIGTHAGCLPHHVIITSGQLPPGLTLTQIGYQTALVSGVATEVGTFSAWMAVKDCENKSAEALFTFDVWARRFGIDTQTLPTATAGSSYSTTLQTWGIPSVTTWQVTKGALPAGLALSRDGVISGTPTAPGTATFTVGATGNAKDFTGERVDSRDFTLTVAAPLAVKLSRSALEVGIGARVPVAISGGRAPFTVTADGLPAGTSITSDGVIAGSPARAGTYAVTLHLTDAGGAKTDVSLRLVVRAKLALATRRLAPATAGRRYTARLRTVGGVPALRWSATALARGLALARNGTLSGAPRAKGAFGVTVRVRDSLGASARKTFVLRVR
jgi:Putative Ig domain